MFQGYFDASGTKEHPFITFAGLADIGGNWTAFSEDWDAALKRHHLEVFKMQIESKRPIKKRDARILDFFSVIKKHVRYKINCSLDVAAFGSIVSLSIQRARQLVSGKSYLLLFMEQLVDDPQFWLLMNTIPSFAIGARERGYKHQFDLFIDEQTIEMCKAVPVFYEIVKSQSPSKFRDMYPSQMISLSDTKFRPLQAADMLAWIARRQDSSDIEGWEWLTSEFQEIESMKCEPLNQSQIEKLMNAMLSYMTGPQTEFTQAQIERWAKLIPLSRPNQPNSRGPSSK